MQKICPYDAIRQRLEIQRQELLRSTDAQLHELRNENDENTWDDGREEIDSFSHDVSSILVEYSSEELVQIEQALKRFDEGTYGRCELCGKEIAFERLEALPHATTCVTCQEQQESNGPAGFFVCRPTEWSKMTLEHSDPASGRESLHSDGNFQGGSKDVAAQ